MPFEQRPNSGTLFPNDYKTAGSKDPDYRGTGEVNGRKVDIAGWTKQGKRGTFISLAFGPPRDRQPNPQSGGGPPRPAQQRLPAVESGPSEESEIPF